METPKGRCIVIDTPSNVVIMENMDVYEIYLDKEDWTLVRKLPMKADINFDEYYGDDGKATWFNDRLPVQVENNELIWDY